jgi:putative NADH-flavin reductase
VADTADVDGLVAVLKGHDVVVASISPGQRTGTFRLGLDHLLEDEKGTSLISREDFAIAVVDEIETPKHMKRRFTVAY